MKASNNSEFQKNNFTPKYDIDIIKMSEFLNDHLIDLKSELDDNNFGKKEETEDYDYLEIVKDYKKEKILENTLFFYMGKEFQKNPSEIIKGTKNKLKKNYLNEKYKISYRINPITQCHINFSDDEVSNNHSDIDIYLEN